MIQSLVEKHEMLAYLQRNIDKSPAALTYYSVKKNLIEKFGQETFDIYKQDIEKSELLSESTILQENASQDGSILDEEINEIANEGILNNQNSDNIHVDEQTNINQLETSSLEENIDDKAFVQNEATQTLDQIETDNISVEVSSSSLDIDKPNEASVRRLSLFDTLSTENKSQDIASENDILTKNEPVFASSEEKIEENDSYDNNSEDESVSFIRENHSEVNKLSNLIKIMALQKAIIAEFLKLKKNSFAL